VCRECATSATTTASGAFGACVVCGHHANLSPTGLCDVDVFPYEPFAGKNSVFICNSCRSYCGVTNANARTRLGDLRLRYGTSTLPDPTRQVASWPSIPLVREEDTSMDDLLSAFETSVRVTDNTSLFVVGRGLAVYGI